MEDTWIVFIVGTIVSYCLIYWCWTRLIARRAKKSGGRKEPAANAAQQQFIDTLREEAMARIDDALATAIKGESGSNSNREGATGSEAEIFSRLGEMRRTVQSLFSGEVVAAYDNVIAALKMQSPSVSELSKGITELRMKMLDHLEARARGRMIEQRAMS